MKTHKSLIMKIRVLQIKKMNKQIKKITIKKNKKKEK